MEGFFLGILKKLQLAPMRARFGISMKVLIRLVLKNVAWVKRPR